MKLDVSDVGRARQTLLAGRTTKRLGHKKVEKDPRLVGDLNSVSCNSCYSIRMAAATCLKMKTLVGDRCQRWCARDLL